MIERGLEVQLKEEGQSRSACSHLELNSGEVIDWVKFSFFPPFLTRKSMRKLLYLFIFCTTLGCVFLTTLREDDEQKWVTSMATQRCSSRFCQVEMDCSFLRRSVQQSECLQWHQETQMCGGCLIFVIWWELENGLISDILQFVVLHSENSLSF